jgi:predicted aldo/keto reductase-like oxidoreductase
MSELSRRDFLLRSTAAAAAAAVAPRLAFGAQAVEVAPAKIQTGVDLVTLGRSKIETSVLGLGTGTVGGREQRDLGQEAFTKLVREAFDRGVRYIDTADTYRIHPMVAEAVKQLPREKLFIQTKTWGKTAEAVEADVERFRRELNIETLDTCVMHCMTKKGWTTELRPVIDVLLEAKRKGRIRAIGVSCHTLDALAESVDCDEMDVYLVRINHAGDKMDAPPDQVAPLMRRMHEKGRGVIGMKIYGEGNFKTPEQRFKALQYVLGLGCVQAFTIGFKNIDQIDETLAMIKEAAA